MKLQIFITLGLSFLLIVVGNAQKALSDPIGFNKVVCLSNSDTVVSVPFNNTTNSISDEISGDITQSEEIATFTLKDNLTLVENFYKDAYYIHLLSGELKGEIFKITGNTESTLSVDFSGDDITLLSDGDKFVIYRFWTLETLFPRGNTAIIDSLGSRQSQRRTEVLIYDRAVSGVNKVASGIYYRLSESDSLPNGEWKDNANRETIANDVIIWPNTSVVIRHRSSVSQNTTFFAKGVANLNITSVPLFTSSTSRRDNHISVPRPIPVALKDLALISSGAFVSSLNSRLSGRRDELLVFNNGTPSTNRVASDIYYHNGTNWISNGNREIADDVVLLPSQGIVVRKFPEGEAKTSFWVEPAFLTE